MFNCVCLILSGYRKCRRWRYGKLWCKACGCGKICKPKYCSRKVCKIVLCGYKLVCHLVVRYRIVKYKVKIPKYGFGYYGPKYVWKVKKVPYTVKVCKKIPKSCKKCHLVTYICGKRCRTVCKYRKVGVCIQDFENLFTYCCPHRGNKTSRQLTHKAIVKY